MFRIVLVEPEIPPNTGNVIRLAANTGCELHLIEPLGFELTDYHLRRAGLDYHEYATLKTHKSFAAFCESEWGKNEPDLQRCFAFTTKGSRPFHEIAFQRGDCFIFGSETRGLSDALRESFQPAQRVRLPMLPGQRSLNLSNTVAITVFEAWRQCGFEGGS